MKNILTLTILFLLNVNFTFSQDTYPNGQIKEMGNQQNGEYISYYENGQIRWKENYVNWKRNGEYIEYYENGQIKEKGSYVNWFKNGEWIEYYENFQFKKNYLNGVINGESIMLKNGQIIQKDYYQYGIHSESIKYNEKGVIEEKKIYSDLIEIVSTKDGVTSGYSSNNELKYKGYVINGKLEGEWIEYHDGKVHEKGKYLNGLRNGEWIIYDREGKVIRVKENWFNGIMTGGEKFEYYSNGKIRTKINYIGKLGRNGTYGETSEIHGIEYFENGKIKGKVNSIYGDSDFTEYYENGQVKNSGFFTTNRTNLDKPIKSGEWIEYYENGQIKEEKRYDMNGKEVK